MVDALASGVSVLTDVWVKLPPLAPKSRKVKVRFLSHRGAISLTYVAIDSTNSATISKSHTKQPLFGARGGT